MQGASVMGCSNATEEGGYECAGKGIIATAYAKSQAPLNGFIPLDR